MTSRPDPIAGPLAVDEHILASVAEGVHWDPHGVLGPHLSDTGVTVRALRPLADAVSVETSNGSVAMEHEADGIWVAFLSDAEAVPDYRLATTYGDNTVTVDDPYRHLPTVSDFDLHLIREGRHEQLWQTLGANVRTFPSELGDVTGTAFAVWAPNARAVRILCDANHWQGRAHAMRSLGSSGVWELFVPGIGPGTRYKFEIQHPDGTWQQKADPMAKGTQVPPENASVVVASEYEWADDVWLTRRSESNPHNRPMSVYEVHLGSWRPGLSYRELADQLTDYVDELGFTHVEFLPVAEHPFGGSWGYQVTSYYAPTSRFGHPDDFRYLVDALHQRGIGVLVDWVPAHFPKDEWALGRFDGTPLYEDPDPRRGEHPDWGTYIFNFGRAEVRNFLVANANYWFEEFHIDGLRVDAVASMLYLDYSRTDGQWTPNVHGGRENLEAIAFMQEANATAYRRYPGIMMIAEESTAYPGVTAPTDRGGLGFGFKWNMGWMNDSLRYFARDPIHRPYHHDEITFSLVYAFSEQFVLPFSHDEVVHGKGSLYGKMPGDDWQKRANLRAILTYQWTHPGAPLLFMGQEFGQHSEWSETDGIAWHDADTDGGRGISRLVGDLNNLLSNEPALWQRDHTPDGFRWLSADGVIGNSIGFLRVADDGYPLAVIINLSGQPLESYRVGLPHAGGWDEILNTDAPIYGGSGVGNLGHVRAEDLPWDGQPASAKVRIPPLGAVIFKPDGE